nr:ZIP family metal transporter [Candidatus Njordarchaeum guaymaensis]
MAVDLAYAALLGVVSGLIPVYLGIAPWGAIKKSGVVARTVLISFAIGVLLFLFVDVFHEAQEGAELVGTGVGQGLLLAGFVTGLLGLAVYESLRGRRRAHVKGYHPERVESQGEKKSIRATVSFAYLIALGIGLHNLGEGLAIGSAYAAGQVTLSYLLIIGFALHNGTEGFGIIASIPKDHTRLRDPVLMGLIAGAPTALGSMIGAVLYSVALSVLFLALASGAILYVVVELIPVAYTREHRHLILVGITLGIVMMYLTDLLLSL